VHPLDFGGDVGGKPGAEPPFGHRAQGAVEVELFPVGDGGARWRRGGSDVAVEGDEPAVGSTRTRWRQLVQLLGHVQVTAVSRLNAPSPAATAAIPIGQHIVGRALSQR